ncbi:hypothetical protein EYC84_011403 [Monilinia fructicola]|uniref:Uncharacterized protein n=1 Tax=Monilinia fructicola TaxID=38448 RepID=A0A5M9J7I7_MONFR|nr:hypothetical protein EYC84_011403 [Monilinia fructicola]
MADMFGIEEFAVSYGSDTQYSALGGMGSGHRLGFGFFSISWSEVLVIRVYISSVVGIAYRYNYTSQSKQITLRPKEHKRSYHQGEHQHQHQIANSRLWNLRIGVLDYIDETFAAWPFPPFLYPQPNSHGRHVALPPRTQHPALCLLAQTASSTTSLCARNIYKSQPLNTSKGAGRGEEESKDRGRGVIQCAY